MAVIDIQKALGVAADGWYGDNTHTARVAANRPLIFNWEYIRRKIGGGSFSQGQVDGLNHILTACNDKFLRPQHAAYILATVWHETARTMQPISEYGRGKSRRYGRWFTNSNGVKYGIRNGAKEQPKYLASEYPHLYYGRGYPQLTWLDNYIFAGDQLGIDLANNPELANDPKHSADIMVNGSMGGWFTTRSLGKIVTFGHYAEFVAARAVINGSDRAADIATLAKNFLTGLDI